MVPFTSYVTKPRSEYAAAYFLSNVYFDAWQPFNKSILFPNINIVSFIFRLVGYCSVVLLLIKELGKVKYCTIENHLYLWLALCVSTSSTGSSDTRKNASNTDKRITNEKNVTKKSVFRAQYNSRWVIDGSSMSNQLHQWVIDGHNFWASITHRLLIDHRQ